MGDSHFCKWEFGSPKEYSEKPTKQRKRKKPKPQQEQSVCSEVGSALVVTDLSGLCLSQSVSLLVYALSFVPLLVSFLRLSELPLLSFLLDPCYPSLASIHAVPMPGPCASRVIGIAVSMPKTFHGLGQIPATPVRVMGVLSQCSWRNSWSFVCSLKF